LHFQRTFTSSQAGRFTAGRRTPQSSCLRDFVV